MWIERVRGASQNVLRGGSNADKIIVLPDKRNDVRLEKEKWSYYNWPKRQFLRKLLWLNSRVRMSNNWVKSFNTSELSASLKIKNFNL
jgi:hypothetical protein